MDRATRKLDTRLLNIQKIITNATATLVNASHNMKTVVANPSACVEQRNMRFVEVAMKLW